MDRRIVDQVLALYPARFWAQRFSRPTDGAGFSGATVLRLETSAGTFALRGWPPGNTSSGRIGGLHRLLSHLRLSGVMFVAVPVCSNDGPTLVRQNERWWQLEPWLPGRADFWSQPGELKLKNASAALARLHQAAALFSPSVEDETWFFRRAEAPSPAILERIERLTSWNAEKLASLRDRSDVLSAAGPDWEDVLRSILRGFEQCSAAVEHELRAALRLCVPILPCFRDVWHDHVLFEGDTVSGIIDPSAARSDTVATDLSRMLGSLVGDDRTRWDVALSAYDRIRPLSANERTLIEVLDRSGVLLSAMAWLEAPELPVASPDMRQRLLERLGRIADRLDTLCQLLR